MILIPPFSGGIFVFALRVSKPNHSICDKLATEISRLLRVLSMTLGDATHLAELILKNPRVIFSALPKYTRLFYSKTLHDIYRHRTSPTFVWLAGSVRESDPARKENGSVDKQKAGCLKDTPLFVCSLISAFQYFLLLQYPFEYFDIVLGSKDVERQMQELSF